MLSTGDIRLTAAIVQMSDNATLWVREKVVKESDFYQTFESELFKFGNEAITESEKYENCLVFPVPELVEEENCPCCPESPTYTIVGRDNILGIMRDNYEEEYGKLKRNSKCYCKSGKKYKKCHLRYDQENKKQEHVERSQHLDLDGLELGRATKRKIREAFIKMPESANDGDIVIASRVIGKTVESQIKAGSSPQAGDFNILLRREAKAIKSVVPEFDFVDEKMSREKALEDREKFLEDKQSQAIQANPELLKLKEKLLAIEGGYVLLPSQEEFLTELLSGGTQIFPHPHPHPAHPEISIKVVQGIKSRCHHNTAAMWQMMASPEDLKICTGYALSEDSDGIRLWRQHSWLLDLSMRCLYETTTERKIYWGCVLSKEETSKFLEVVNLAP